ncbi:MULTISPECIES: hypothetical protein [Chitinophagaceae]|uniref:hypothetical protein n=1 Tax=Chitinophagaceae TaxID=563835 RepID=UPI000DEF0D1B|nr:MULTISPECIES: hypothetical protein [Chitinophagaceae]RPD50971.1 hypothetical protein DRJ53_05625 [Paracnuella aquatica]
MKRKCTLCITLILFISQISFAQIRFPVPTGIRADLQKVVDDYPAQFAAIRGEVVDRNPQSTEYRSKIKIADADHCSIIAYSSGSKPVYSWQALLYTTEDYVAAAKKYKWLYQQIKGANLFYLKDQYTLRGNYQEADESRGFAVSTLALVAPPTQYQKLRVDVSMQFEFPEWKVQLLVYDKERDDDEAGAGDE